jgi:small subunit ribosomal protein S20
VANIKSQIKRIKTNEKARLRNKPVSSAIKTAVRKFRAAVVTGDHAVITTELRTASKALDVAVAKGVIHKNAAANKKSSMAKSATKAGVR